MSITNPYCSVEEVQAALKNRDVGLVPEIETAIARASRWIDDYQRRDYFQHDYSSSPLVLTSQDGCVIGDVLYLPYKPVLQLTVVSEAGVALAANTDFVVKSSTIHRVGQDWEIGDVPADGISLTGKFGYAQATADAIPTGIPDQIRYAAVLVAAAFTGHNRKEVVGLDGVRTEILSNEIPKTVYEILRRKAPMLN